MEIRLLNYFISVAKHKSFSKAAENLYVSQPTISRAIQAFEQELGVTLFDRKTTHVELTDAGKIAFQQAEQIVHSFNKLATEIADVMNLNKGEISIGLPPMVGARLFPKILGEFSQQYPQITLNLIEVGSKEVEHQVYSGSLDLGVVMLPVEEPTLEIMPISKDPLMLIVSPDDTLAEQPAIDIRQLREKPFILFDEAFSLHNFILQNCQQHGFIPKVICKSSQWDLIVEMVACKLGIAFLPQKICKDLNPDSIRAIPLKDKTLSWDLAIIWRNDKYVSFAARRWLSFTAAQFGAALCIK